MTTTLHYEPRHGWLGYGGSWRVVVADEFGWIDDDVDLGIRDPTDRDGAVAEAVRRGFEVTPAPTVMLIGHDQQP